MKSIYSYFSPYVRSLERENERLLRMLLHTAGIVDEVELEKMRLAQREGMLAEPQAVQQRVAYQGVSPHDYLRVLEEESRAAYRKGLTEQTKRNGGA